MVTKREKVIEELVKLVGEESTESAHAAFKLLRHGMEAEHPETGETNIEALARELGQTVGIIRLLVDYNVISWQDIEDGAKKKLENLNPYVHTFQVYEGKVHPNHLKG